LVYLHRFGLAFGFWLLAFCGVWYLLWSLFTAQPQKNVTFATARPPAEPGPVAALSVHNSNFIIRKPGWICAQSQGITKRVHFPNSNAGRLQGSDGADLCIGGAVACGCVRFKMGHDKRQRLDMHG
jgi:hypothetical protein